MYGQGIDVLDGTNNNKKVNGVIVTIDLIKKDSEIKILIVCTVDEGEKIKENYMAGISVCHS